jgi:hypothetical protein
MSTGYAAAVPGPFILTRAWRLAMFADSKVYKFSLDFPARTRQTRCETTLPQHVAHFFTPYFTRRFLCSRKKVPFFMVGDIYATY